MERIDAFEKMLADVLERQRQERETMDALRAQGKTNTATFKQLMGNRLVYNQMIALYKEYGLV